MDQQQQPRERSFIRELVPDWRPTREQRLWVIRIVILFVVVLGVLTLISWPFGITLWEWVKILIVPAVIAGGGIWFNRQQQQREEEIQKQDAREAALQAYLDKMTQLLLEKDLRSSEVESPERTLARSRTLTVLRMLDPGRKRSVLDFLYEANLIKCKQTKLSPDIRMSLHSHYTPPVIVLGSPDSNYGAADLSGADLRGAFLSDADLGADEQSDYKGANLSGADLSGADLSGANLFNADLSGANLFNADVAEWQLYEATSLEGATMPDGRTSP